MNTQTITGTVISTRITPFQDGSQLSRVNIRCVAVENGQQITRFHTFSSRDHRYASLLEAGAIGFESSIIADVDGEIVTALRLA